MGRSLFNPSYICRRTDILALVPQSAIKELDIGCSVGALGREIKARKSAIVFGIEIEPDMDEVAESKLDKVYWGDVESLNLPELLGDMTFDCNIFGDDLEHLKDPRTVLTDLTEHLDREGDVIASKPNLRHYTTILSLLSGYWPYRDRGIHDRIHLRFFALENITEMFEDAGLRILKFRRT